MGVETRLVRGEEDRRAAYRIRRVVFVDEQQVPEDIELDEYDADADHVLLLLDGEPVATARLVVRPDGVGVVGRVAVLGEHRGTGLGDAVMDAIEARAAERGLRAIELHAQTYVRGFYERRGYHAFGEEYWEAGIRHISMRRDLEVTDTPG